MRSRFKIRIGQLSVVIHRLQKQTATDDGRRATDQFGFTLLELIITLTVLAVMVLATIPLAQNAVKRQREQQLRESLREIRLAIDEFKRDTYGACPQGSITTTNRPDPNSSVPTDPRSRVVIDECTIFTTENVDRYPPTLETLVDGVKVKPRGLNAPTGGGVFNNKESVVFDDDAKDLKKVYLRELPVDPITGKTDWRIRSSYQEKGTDGWDNVNVFDVRSNSDEEALNGEKYSDW
jgi:general secretion pathway protein G